MAWVAGGISHASAFVLVAKPWDDRWRVELFRRSRIPSASRVAREYGGSAPRLLSPTHESRRLKTAQNWAYIAVEVKENVSDWETVIQLDFLLIMLTGGMIAAGLSIKGTKRKERTWEASLDISLLIRYNVNPLHPL